MRSYFFRRRSAVVELIRVADVEAGDELLEDAPGGLRDGLEEADRHAPGTDSGGASPKAPRLRTSGRDSSHVKPLHVDEGGA